ncbi:MAG TPA: phytoene/squalene synthase family protein [Cytophagaceae bacterium]|jgi:phytoene/squalene synthetase
MELYNTTSLGCSKFITSQYSTSFTLGIKALDKKFQLPVYGVYGFVRYADEIVDTFHEHNKTELLSDFRRETFKAIREKISLNPVLHSFQLIVNKYKIEDELIEAFLNSMEMDLYNNSYDEEGYQNYIYGSAEVVGLMCLRIFCEGDQESYSRLREPARSLGSAFQKVNFLRDIKSDFKERKRVYFPEVDFSDFQENEKLAIEASIKKDFDFAFEGIKKLPDGARLGVYLAYIYYQTLFKKIQNVAPSEIMEKRIRVSDNHKFALFIGTYFRHRFNFL